MTRLPALLAALLLVLTGLAGASATAERIGLEVRAAALAERGVAADDLCGGDHAGPGHCPLCRLTEGPGQATAPARAVSASVPGAAATPAPCPVRPAPRIRPPSRAPPAA